MPVIEPETHPYAKRGEADLLIDVFRPAGPPKAAVIILHGGGWRVGQKEWMAPVAQALAGFGFLALPMQYRLLDDAPWPAQIQDVKSAIRWTRRNSAALGIDPARIAVEGFSAGGHLALLAAGTAREPAYSHPTDDVQVDCSVAAAVAFFPPVEFQVGGSAPGVSDASRLLQASATSAEAERASPIHHAGPQFPPTCLFHGTDDHVVAPVASQRMFDRLRAAGAAVDLHLLAGHTHEFSALPSMLPHVQGIAASFLERHVVDPDYYIQENLTLNNFARRR